MAEDETSTTPTTAHEISAAIKETALAMDSRARSMMQHKERGKQIEAEVMVRVSEVNAPGSIKPLYTNVQQRDAAAKVELDKDATYRAVTVAHDEAQQYQMRDSIYLDWLRRQFQIALIDYEAARLGRRDNTGLNR